MSLVLNAQEAKKADYVNSNITETGKYIGVITRAEKLLSKNKVEGIGLSFKADNGGSANYLDLYTTKENGERLRGFNIAQAILCCTRTKEANEGEIEFEKWDKDTKKMSKTTAIGYPALMGKRIGLLLQKELDTNNQTGADVERVTIFGVFEADTEFTSSEILDKSLKPEQLEKMMLSLMSRPVRDNRAKPTHQINTSAPDLSDIDSDLPF